MKKLRKILSGLKSRYWKTELPVVQYKLGGGGNSKQLKVLYVLHPIKTTPGYLD